jgi:hypothetical protein
VLFVAALLVVVPSLLGFVRSVTLCTLMIFVIKKSFFLSCCLLFCCLSAFEQDLRCFWSIRVLWRRTVMYYVNLMDGEFFLSCAIYNNSSIVQCEQISLESASCTVSLWKVASPFVSVVLVMVKNEPLRFHAALSGPNGPCFYYCKSTYGPFSFFFLTLSLPFSLRPLQNPNL